MSERVFVHGKGPRSARIVVVGDAPGLEEVRQTQRKAVAYGCSSRTLPEGCPFAGPGGYKLEGWMRQAGINPRSVRYEYVSPCMPQDGDIHTIPWQELVAWGDDLRGRLDRCQDVTVIVPMGNLALSLCTGNPQSRGPTPPEEKQGWHWAFETPGITAWRGSILHYAGRTDRDIKCIPTLHPAAIVYRSRKQARTKASLDHGGEVLWEKRCLRDWVRIAQEAQFPEFRLPDRTLVYNARTDDLGSLVRRVQDFPLRPLAIDIETIPAEGKIICVSFAINAVVAISIPWNTQTYAGIKTVCESRNPKILQNGFYDFFWLAKQGTTLQNYVYDTRAMQQLLDPLESASLAFLTSIYTREPYYKSTQETPEERGARDAAVTWEVWEALWHEINQRNLCDQYRELYAALFAPLLDMMQRGIRMDSTACKQAYTQSQRDAKNLRKFFTLETVDDDGYMRCEHSYAVVTHQLASKANPMGTGRNLQNIPHAARRVFVPDPGHLFLSIEAHEAETRTVYMRTGDPDLIARAQSKPWEMELVSNEAKIVEHCGNYDDGPVILQRKLAEAGITKSREECKRSLQAKFQATPGVHSWQVHIRQQILLTRRLTNSWNRTISLASMPFSQETYRFAYAWLNQSDIGMLMTLRGIIPLFRFLTGGAFDARIVTQERAGLLVSTQPEHAWEIMDFLRHWLERPLFVQGIDGKERPLSIPMTVKLSTTWCTDARIVEQYKDQGLWCHEFVQPPTQEEWGVCLSSLKTSI